ncbi:MAG: hypothetical protein PHP50_12440 [Lachnospiraceae bacterium]|nr:hypothetical protein [Lachnospiraceae bacterium]
MKAESIILEELHMENRENWQQKLGYNIAAFLLLPGFLAVVRCFYYSRGSRVLLFCSLLLPVVMCLTTDRKWKELPKYAAVALMLVCVLINPVGFSTGLAYFVNQCITAWNHHFTVYISLYELSGISDFNQMQFWGVVIGAFYLLWKWSSDNSGLKYLGFFETALL